MRDELDELDEAREIVAATRVTRTYLTRAAAAALDAAGWSEDRLVERLLAGDGGDVDLARQRDNNDLALGWLQEFDARGEEDAEPPAVAAVWHLPGGAVAHILVEIGLADPVGDRRTGTAYLFLDNERGN